LKADSQILIGLLTVSAQHVENVALNAPQCGECCFEMGLSVIIIHFFLDSMQPISFGPLWSPYRRSRFNCFSWAGKKASWD